VETPHIFIKSVVVGSEVCYNHK